MGGGWWRPQASGSSNIASSGLLLIRSSNRALTECHRPLPISPKASAAQESPWARVQWAGCRMYGKLFRQMYEGSLAKAGWEAIVTIQQLVILADKSGTVDMTADSI